MNLSEQQLAGIRQVITNGGVTMQTLQDDLIDHLCCVVEYKMKAGEKYEVALASAVSELAPGGLVEIQKETQFLLNSNRILFMKKITYLLGLLFSMAFITGWLFGLLHLPGATELSIGGFNGIALVFVPLLAFDYFKVKIQRAMSEKAMVIAGIISVTIMGTAVVFKLLHLRGADIMLVTGFVCFIGGFLPLLFFKLYRKSVANG